MAKKKLAPRKVAAKKPKAKKAPQAKPSQKKPLVAKKPAQKSKPKNSPAARSSPKSVKGGVKAPAKTTAKSKTKVKSDASNETLLHVGDLAPAFSAPNENGETVSSDSLRGKKLVLYFYPKDDTPGCTQESCDFRDHFARVKSSGAEVLGVSRDSAKSHARFKEKHSFPFSLLSDEDGKICEAFGVWKEKFLYGRKYMGIERTTFLIDFSSDENGRILKVYPKVKVQGHVDQILEDLK